MDATAMLGSGVYVLRQHGRPVYVGWAKCLLTMIAGHREYASLKAPSWFPIKGVRFDSFEFRPCPAHRADEELMRLKAEVYIDCAA